jgi:hypothetical protein
MIGLISVVTFMVLVDVNMKLRNKIILSLAAPFIGGLAVALGTVFMMLLLALFIFGGLFYIFNRKKVNMWFQRRPRFGLFYRYY